MLYRYNRPRTLVDIIIVSCMLLSLALFHSSEKNIVHEISMAQNKISYLKESQSEIEETLADTSERALHIENVLRKEKRVDLEDENRVRELNERARLHSINHELYDQLMNKDKEYRSAFLQNQRLLTSTADIMHRHIRLIQDHQSLMLAESRGSRDRYDWYSARIMLEEHLRNLSIEMNLYQQRSLTFTNQTNILDGLLERCRYQKYQLYQSYEGSGSQLK